MESPRLRKMMALARWHDEWAARHPDDAPDADAEFIMGARKIMGLDPETGIRVVAGGSGLGAAVEAACAEDLDRLQTLVDWPLTGAGPIVRSLPGVLERDRADVVASGLAELDAAADDPELVAGILGPLAERLAGAREIRPADASTSAAALAAVRIPPAPPGLTDAQRDRLTALAERAAALREVHVIVAGQGELPVVVTGAGLLVLDLG